MSTLKVKPWGHDQGDFVIINTEDFDPNIHVKYGAPDAEKPKRASKQIKQETEVTEE